MPLNSDILGERSTFRAIRCVERSHPIFFDRLTAQMERGCRESQNSCNRPGDVPVPNRICPESDPESDPGMFPKTTTPESLDSEFVPVPNREIVPVPNRGRQPPSLLTRSLCLSRIGKLCLSQIGDPNRGRFSLGRVDCRKMGGGVWVRVCRAEPSSHARRGSSIRNAG